MSTAVLLIAHGSRRSEANADLVQLAELVRAQNLYPIVETAYLEIAEPGISAAGAACVDRGATTVKLLPYFLSAGAHVVDDLESHRRELSAQFPGVTFELCPPLGLHPLMVEIVLARLTEGAAGSVDVV
ncbi:MAG: sirohydrochlorin cobaltochelatase [Planctomycetia bacterium]|nr:sirohydrochlorin cobaltochelatase [Planctomycetia bacterium]